MTRVTNLDEVLAALDDLDYPASKQDIVRHAEESGAGPQALAAVRALPLAEYASPEELVRSLPLDPAPERSASERAEQARVQSDSRVAEHLRQTGE